MKIMYELFVFVVLTVFIVQGTAVESSVILNTAVSLVHEAEDRFSNDNCICKTWILAGRHTNNYFEDSTSFSGQSDHKYRAKVLISKSNFSEYSDLSLEREYTFNDNVNGWYFGIAKFTPHCQVVYLLGNSLPSFTGMMKALISQKFARPHRDYTLIIGNSEAPAQFYASTLTKEFRHKYLLEFKDNSLVKISDFCTPNRESKIELFQPNCGQFLNGKHLDISSVLGTPYIRFQTNEDGSLRWGEGIYMDLLKDSSRKFNYTFKLFGANSRGSSGFKKDGVWYGAMSDVFYGRADFAVGAGITDQRDAVVDDGVPFEWNARIFFVRSPPLKTSWKAIFWPFDALVWSLIICTPLLIIPVYYLSVRQSYNNDSNSNTDRSTNIISDVISSLLAILLDQSTTARRWVGFQIRFLVVLWMVFCIVMGAGYRSRLINYLTFIVPDNVPTTHQELIEEDYTLFFRFYGGIAYNYAATSKDPIQKAVIRKAILVNSSQECVIRAAITDKSACLNWEFHGDYATFTNATPRVHQHPDEQLILKSRDATMTILIAWVYSKRSPLREIFDRYIMQTLCTGLYENWLEQDFTKSKLEGATWMNSNKDSPANKQMLAHYKAFSANPKPLQLSSLYGLFSLSGTCLLCAVVIWFVEIGLNLIQKLNMKNQHRITYG